MKTLKSSHRQQIRGLDYFHAYGSDGFDSLEDVVTQLEENNLVDKEWATTMKMRLHELHYFLNVEYRGRIREGSTVADISSTYALSDPQNPEFSTALLIPTTQCSECRLLAETINDIAVSVQKANYRDRREKAEANYLVGNAKKNIGNWKAHIVRTYQQNLGRERVMKNLQKHQTIIWIDWAMRWIPERGRESQAEFFGKAGLPWHIAVAYKRNEDGTGYDVRYFVHSFESAKEDSAAVVAIIKDTLRRIKSECSHINETIIFSDNARCYKSGNTMAAMSRMKADTGIAVVQWDFSDAQSGKGPPDRFAATAKRKARIYLAEGNNCDTSDAFVTCINSHHGTEGMTAIVSELECDDISGKASKIKDIAKLHNFEFYENDILVRRAFNIGKGRTVPLATLNPSYLKCELIEKRVANRGIDQNTPLTTDDQWKSLASREPTRAEKQPEENEHTSETEEGNVERLRSSAGLYGCPTPGCTKVFQHYKNLQNHLELGNHRFKPEKESLRDFVIREYKDRVDHLQLNRFQEMREAISSVGAENTCPINNELHISKGWALQTREVEHFSKKVKDYLNAKFQEGVDNPKKKWKPAALAKAMRKDPHFDASEFLNAKQIASYFSRLDYQRAMDRFNQAEATRREGDGEEDEIDEPSAFEHDSERDNIDEVIEEVEAELFNGLT